MTYIQFQVYYSAQGTEAVKEAYKEFIQLIKEKHFESPKHAICHFAPRFFEITKNRRIC